MPNKPKINIIKKSLLKRLKEAAIKHKYKIASSAAIIAGSAFLYNKHTKNKAQILKAQKEAAHKKAKSHWKSAHMQLRAAKEAENEEMRIKAIKAAKLEAAANLKAQKEAAQILKAAKLEAEAAKLEEAQKEAAQNLKAANRHPIVPAPQLVRSNGFGILNKRFHKNNIKFLKSFNLKK